MYLYSRSWLKLRYEIISRRWLRKWLQGSSLSILLGPFCKQSTLGWFSTLWVSNASICMLWWALFSKQFLLPRHGSLVSWQLCNYYSKNGVVKVRIQVGIYLWSKQEFCSFCTRMWTWGSLPIFYWDKWPGSTQQYCTWVSSWDYTNLASQASFMVHF